MGLFQQPVDNWLLIFKLSLPFPSSCLASLSTPPEWLLFPVPPTRGEVEKYPAFPPRIPDKPYFFILVAFL